MGDLAGGLIPMATKKRAARKTAAKKTPAAHATSAVTCAAGHPLNGDQCRREINTGEACTS